MPYLSLLLNWRIWAGVALASSLLFSFVSGYKHGEKSVQEAFDKYKTEQTQQALKQQQLAQAKEQAMQTNNLKLGDDLATQTSKTNTAINNLNALRLRQRTTGSSVLPQDPTPSGSFASSSQDGVLAECRDRRDQLAGEAQQLSDQVSGLQQYIQGVLQNGSPQSP